MSTLEQRLLEYRIKVDVGSLPFKEQIRLALEATHELIKDEGYTYNWDAYDFDKECCVGGAFFHKYGCTSSNGQLSQVAFAAMNEDPMGINRHTVPSLEAMLIVAKRRGLI